MQQQRHITIIGMTNGHPVELKRKQSTSAVQGHILTPNLDVFFLTRQQTIHGKGFLGRGHCSGVMTTCIYYEHFLREKKK